MGSKKKKQPQQGAGFFVSINRCGYVFSLPRYWYMLLRSVFHHRPSSSTVTGIGGITLLQVVRVCLFPFHTNTKYSSNWIITPTHDGWKQRFAQKKNRTDWSFPFFRHLCCKLNNILYKFDLLPSISPTRILWILWDNFTVKLYFPSILAGKKTPSKSNKSHDLDLWTPLNSWKWRCCTLDLLVSMPKKRSSNIG